MTDYFAGRNLLTLIPSCKRVMDVIRRHWCYNLLCFENFPMNILLNHSIHWVVPTSSASNQTHSANKLMGGLVNSTCNLSLPKRNSVVFCTLSSMLLFAFNCEPVVPRLISIAWIHALFAFNHDQLHHVHFWSQPILPSITAKWVIFDFLSANTV